VQVQLGELQAEQDALDVLYNERLDTFESATDSLYVDSALTASDVYALVSFDPNELPEEFYNRTAHTSNPGVRVLSEISNFVNRAITLPEFNYNPVSRDSA
jgi:hypothetical protein